MIVVKNIGGRPESNPGTKFGKLFDGENHIFFESDSEREEYLQSLNVFSLEAWKSEVNTLHNQLFQSYYEALRYESEADIALTALNSAQFAAEALALAKWRNDTYDIIDAVTEVEAQETTPQNFINTLPIFNVQEANED